MLDHHAFFERLGSLQENTPSWDTTLAGVLVLRTIDRLVAEPEQWNRDDFRLSIESARAQLNAVPAGDPVRALLVRILDSVVQSPELLNETGSALLGYGRALDLRGQWQLAADVFRTASESFRVSNHAGIVVEALLALGAAARSAGNWEGSGKAYTQAEHLAERMGNRALALTAQIGLAVSQMIRGNLPAADDEFERIYLEASKAGLEQTQALALHNRASVAHLRTDYRTSIHFAYRALELTRDPSARERLLADIAAAYAGLGMRDVARDGYSIVAVTSPHQWVRSQATLNLMELAIYDGDEPRFDEYVRQVANNPLDPKLQAYFLYFRALGSRRFSRDDAAELFNAAQSIAEASELHQLAFEIEAAKVASPPFGEPASSQSLESTSLEEGVPEEGQSFDASASELRRIAEVLGHLRDSAGISLD
jgi:hypothetical protein